MATLVAVVAGGVLGAPGAVPEASQPAVAVVAPSPADEGSLVTGGYPPRRLPAVPEREHGTDGLMGSLPFGALLAERVVPVSIRRGATRPNGGLGWQTDPAAL